MPIRHSVGSGGVNIRGDVYYVQLLLSDYLCRNFAPPIKVDGIVGPKTIAAIQEAQHDFVITVDGRVDPKGPTLAALERAHLAGIVNSQLDPTARKYFKPDASANLMIQRLVTLYLKKLRDGMGEGPPQQTPEGRGGEPAGTIEVMPSS